MENSKNVYIRRQSIKKGTCEAASQRGIRHARDGGVV